jgi:hypothetical protein
LKECVQGGGGGIKEARREEGGRLKRGDYRRQRGEEEEGDYKRQRGEEGAALVSF